MKRFLLYSLILLVFYPFGSEASLPDVGAAKSDTLRLFLIGNSFSRNAARFLPQLAEEGQHPLVIGRAEIGGCSLQKHWELAEAAEKNPDDPKGKPYNGKSLRMLLSEGKWDVVTIQQNSMNSGYVESYLPYARKLHDFIQSIQPQARVVFHQTWAYRSDSKDFTLIESGLNARNAKEMWKKLHKAYYSVASAIGMEVIPVGDAFRKASKGEKAYRADRNFDFSNPVYPALPDQTYSLHTGYYWTENEKLNFDSHHANEAGCYLGGLVWYTFLFEDSPVKLTFTPEGVPAEFASHLRKIASKVVKY